MLYIGNNKIIKGYVGNTPVTHVGVGCSSLINLIKISLEKGTIIPTRTDYSIDPSSTFTVEYTLDGVTEDQITVTYDDTFFTKDGNNYTLIGEGYSEIVYNIDGEPASVIRIATSYGEHYNFNYNQSTEPTLPSGMELTKTIGSYGFSHGSYSGGGYGLISQTFNINNSVAHGYIRLDMSTPFYVVINYNISSEPKYDYARFFLTTSSNVSHSDSGYFGTDSNLSGYTDRATKTATSETMKEPGVYYLHFLYRKDSSGYYGNDCLCIKNIEIIGSGKVYPATQLLIESDNIQSKTSESFDIDFTLVPSNSNEEVEVIYDLNYLSKTDETFTPLKTGTTKITYNTRYCSKSINVDIV